jgi:hypothetical protein
MTRAASLAGHGFPLLDRTFSKLRSLVGRATERLSAFAG